jgi:pimeloyl-ACP methyl ester carboxylesterase
MDANSRLVLGENGREIRIIEAGQPGGVPILVHSGTPDSALLYDLWDEDARSRGIRLIGYDRPGYGDSTPRIGRTVANAVDDVAAIAKALNLKELLVWGHSGGGPHALACAALLPDLVVAAAALSSPAPYLSDGLDWLAGMGEDNVAEFGAALEGPDAVRQFVEKAAPGVLGSDPIALVQAMRSLLCPADVEVLTGKLADFILKGMRAGIIETRDGWIEDDIAFTTPWGFELDQIRIPVMLMHGRQDQMVPFSHGQWLASKIPDVATRFLPDDGHLTIPARHIPEVHAWLLDKL